MKYSLMLVLLLIAGAISLEAQTPVNWKSVKVLVYKKNGKGFVHDNIPYAAQAIIDLGKKHGFKVDTSSLSSAMTEENLKQYRMLIFTSTNNDVFDTDAQRLAFRRYIEAGGGFVGIHSVTGTERNWDWFKMLLGGTFAWHDKFQKFKIQVIHPQHPSMKGTPKVWYKEDECYFAKELYPGTHVVMVNDFSGLDTSNAKLNETRAKNAGHLKQYVPSAWYHDFDGGTTWCTTLGHDKKDYADPVYLKHIMGGIEYVARTVKRIDFSKSYAVSSNEPVKY
ncbi:ThuA domain-containing protein [Niabella sp. 22666]|uniref:ThuA domain-containing protein n=1 Tax=Niabella sp. 22666 TaxID=3453954 RepID=UPI003F84CAE1